MTASDKFAALNDEDERIKCLVEQGFTPSLARHVLVSKSPEFTPITIWIVDNSSSMLHTDGKKLVPTSHAHDVRLVPCSRWEELQETVKYHAQLAALLQAPTKFILLNKPSNASSMISSIWNKISTSATTEPSNDEFCIATRNDILPTTQSTTTRTRSTSGSSNNNNIPFQERVDYQLQRVLDSISTIQPQGVTPLTMQLRRIYQSLQREPFVNKATVVIATDGVPTDSFGYRTHLVDEQFEKVLRELQSIAWIVIRLCTNEDNVITYYQNLDEKLELSIEVLDDYLSEAKEVHKHNPWLTYSLCLHRCREMGMSCHGTYRWLDLLDERSLTQFEVFSVIHQLLFDTTGGNNDYRLDYNTFMMNNQKKSGDPKDAWLSYCQQIEKRQNALQLPETMQSLHSNSNNNNNINDHVYDPWNPIRRKPTKWIDIGKLKRLGTTDYTPLIVMLCFVVFVIILFFMDSL